MISYNEAIAGVVDMCQGTDK